MITKKVSSQAEQNSLITDLFKLVPAVGLEPTRGYPQQILSLHRLPFRHAGKRKIFKLLVMRRTAYLI